MNDLRVGVRSASAAVGWGLRTYGWVVVLLAVQLAVLAPLLQALRPVAYEATALVVARRIELTPQALPRFGQAVFARGTLARDVVADPAIGGDAATLIPGRLRVVTPQDSVVFQVIGRDVDPERAARLANVAALAFLTELNRPGAGVGNFALQDTALVPVEPADQRYSTSLLVAVGLLSGMLFGLGIVVMIITVRRPIVSAAEAEHLIGTPVIGAVTLPRFRHREFFGPRGVPGIASVVRAVIDAPASTVLVASSPRAQAARERVSVMLTLAVGRSRPVAFRASATLETIFIEAGSEAAEQRRPSPSPRPTLTIVDGAEPLDDLNVRSGPALTVLVVPEGIPQERLRDLAADYLHGELYGIVIVRIRSRRRLRQVEALHSSSPAAKTMSPNGDPARREDSDTVEAQSEQVVAISAGPADDPPGDQNGSQSVNPN